MEQHLLFEFCVKLPEPVDPVLPRWEEDGGAGTVDVVYVNAAQDECYGSYLLESFDVEHCSIRQVGVGWRDGLEFCGVGRKEGKLGLCEEEVRLCGC